MKVNRCYQLLIAVDENEHHRKVENKLYQGTIYYTTQQMHILKQNDYYKRKF